MDQRHPPHVEYNLTEMGRDLEGVIRAVTIAGAICGCGRCGWRMALNSPS
jgi:hypothetical protein